MRIKFSLTDRDARERLKKDLKSRNDAVVCKRDGCVSIVILIFEMSSSVDNDLQWLKSCIGSADE